MTFDEYQIEAWKTALYPEKGTGSLLALAYCALGLGEQGEIQGKIKKFIRGDYGPDLTGEVRSSILAELGDLLWYVNAAVKELKASLDDVAQGNINKLRDRQKRGVIRGDGDNR